MTHKTHSATCQQRPVAASDLGHISSCPGCGHIQLSLGAVSLRFESLAFRQLVDMLSCAQQRLDADGGLGEQERSAPGGNKLRH